jgi:hypothetical protein
MTRQFTELEERMSPESRARVDKAVQDTLKRLSIGKSQNDQPLPPQSTSQAL